MTGKNRWMSVSLCVGFAWSLLYGAVAGEPAPKLHAVIIRAAGPLPGKEKAQVADAVTEATPQPVNTYVFTAELSRQLARLNVETRIVDFSQCRDLKCLSPQQAEDDTPSADIVVFAGPAFYSRLPKQLQGLLTRLGSVASTSQGLVCSSLIAAWYPDTKGMEAARHVDRAATEAGLRALTGISLLTPRKDKPGVTPDAMKKALADFAARLAETARAPVTKSKN